MAIEAEVTVVPPEVDDLEIRGWTIDACGMIGRRRRRGPDRDSTPEVVMSFSPYLFFVGTCREAMSAYHGIFGGQLEILTAADMPDAPPEVPADAIMHAALTLDNGGMLMASDDPSATEVGPKVGITVSYSAASAADAARVFEALATGGEVQMPLGATSWSPAFGMCTDRFGTPWMVGSDAEG